MLARERSTGTECSPSVAAPSLDGLKPRGGLLYVTSEVYLPIRVPDPDHATLPPTLRKLLTRVHAQSKGGARVNPMGPDATWLLMGSIQLLRAARSGRLERYLALASRQLLAGALRKRCLAAMSTLLEFFRSYTAAKKLFLPAKGAIGECVKSALRCKKTEVKRVRDERTAPREAPGVGASAAGRLAPLLGLRNI